VYSGPVPPAPIRASIVIAAPRDRVWSAWSTPEHLAGWFPDRVEGNLEAGGEARLCWDCYGLELPIDVEEVVSEQRLAFVGTVDGRRRQRQEVLLEPSPEGTRVTVSHEGFATADEREGSAAGWETALAVLRLYVERYFGVARRTLAVLAPVTAALDDLFRHYTEPEGLASWLTAAGRLGAPGEPTALALRNGQIATGRVLTRVPPREVSFFCREIEGVIALKSFSLSAGIPGPTLAGAWLSSWSPEAPALAAVHEALEQGLPDLSWGRS
jgi:uncharacterized protein YndB with AHSA1/START domain